MNNFTPIEFVKKIDLYFVGRLCDNLHNFFVIHCKSFHDLCVLSHSEWHCFLNLSSFNDGFDSFWETRFFVKTFFCNFIVFPVRKVKYVSMYVILYLYAFL